MQPNQLAAFQALQQAQQALHAGDKSTARHFAEQAAAAAPELEEVWLMMAALAEPQVSVEYLQRALQINPASERAQKGMAWAMGRLQKQPEAPPAPPPPPPVEAVPQGQAASVGETTEPNRPVSAPIEAQPAQAPKVAGPLPVSQPKTVTKPPQPAAQPAKTKSRQRVSLIATLALLTCVAAGIVIAYTASPVSALFAPETHGPAWAQADISKSTATDSPEPTATFTFTPSPTLAPTDTATFTITPSISPTPTITHTSTSTDTPPPTATPSITLTDEASPTPLPTDTAMPTRVVPTLAPAQANNPVPGNDGERWIDVNLSQQTVYAYEGDTVVASFVVSTGTWQYPTVTGQYRIYIKYRYKDMSGPGYYLPNVPYTMFFYRGYALHGTYWHSNFGTPMSHGCVNLSIPDAEWLYNFASVGTLVNVHY